MIDATEADDESIIGDMCHMVAESDDGPRADPTVSEAARNSYENLILLCRNHHKEVDDQVGKFSVARLKEIKAAHETWVKEKLATFDAAKQKDEEWYAGTIDEWEKRAGIENWDAWTSWMLSPDPQISKEFFDELNGLRKWLLARIWPGRYLALENAFLNFGNVLNALFEEFGKHAEELSSSYRTDRYYKIREWNEERYHRLLNEYEFHVSLVHALCEELTRAANLIIERARLTMLPSYRDSEGFLLATHGPYENLRVYTSLFRYPPDTAAKHAPFPGLDAFADKLELERMDK